MKRKMNGRGGDGRMLTIVKNCWINQLTREDRACMDRECAEKFETTLKMPALCSLAGVFLSFAMTSSQKRRRSRESLLSLSLSVHSLPFFKQSAWTFTKVVAMVMAAIMVVVVDGGLPLVVSYSGGLSRIRSTKRRNVIRLIATMVWNR